MFVGVSFKSHPRDIQWPMLNHEDPTNQLIEMIVIIAMIINIEKNGQLFSKTISMPKHVFENSCPFFSILIEMTSK